MTTVYLGLALREAPPQTIKATKPVLPSWKFCPRPDVDSSANLDENEDYLASYFNQSVNHFFSTSVPLAKVELLASSRETRRGHGKRYLSRQHRPGRKHAEREGKTIAALLYRVRPITYSLLLALICYPLIESASEDERKRWRYLVKFLVCAFIQKNAYVFLPDKRYKSRGKYLKKPIKIVTEANAL